MKIGNSDAFVREKYLTKNKKQIALSPAYQLAFLTKAEQMLVLDALDYSQNMPSLS